MADEYRDQDGEAQQQPDEQQPDEQPQADEQPVTGEANEQAADQANDADSGKPSGPEAEIEALQARLLHANEQALRAQADAQNAQRRAEKDIEKAHKFGQEKLIRELVVVVDNLERALGSVEQPGDQSVKAITEGVELTLKGLVDTLKNHNVEQIDPQGEPFNPELHQAMTTVESRDVEPKTVMEVFLKGYTLHGRLVRPAMVVVSKAPAEA